MHRKQKGNARGAFGTAFVLTLLVLSLWAGLMCVDYRSRRMRDGERASLEFAAVWQQDGGHGWSEGAEAVWRALPAKVRAIGEIWRTEYEKAEQ